MGKLYTKLLIFLKRKMGNSAALTFVLYVMEVRESGGFFSSSIDPLDYHHLESAFEQAVASSKKANRSSGGRSTRGCARAISPTMTTRWRAVRSSSPRKASRRRRCC